MSLIALSFFRFASVHAKTQRIPLPRYFDVGGGVDPRPPLYLSEN